MSDLPPELAQAFAQALSSGATAAEEDDPPVWIFNNPITAIWTGGDTSQIGYVKRPLSKATIDFYNLSRDELVRFQELAFQAGLYGSSAEREDIPWKAYDPDTFKIWQQMNVSAANAARAGKKSTVWDMLQDLVNNRPEGLDKKKGRERAPLITQLPDPTEIKQLLFDLAPEVIGRDVDEAFTNDFISMYQRMVAEFQENKYALEGTEEGGTITAPPSASALARFRLRHERPEEFEQKRSAERQMEYLSLLKGAI